MTPAGMRVLRWRTVALARSGARTAKGRARSAQVTAALTRTAATA